MVFVQRVSVLLEAAGAAVTHTEGQKLWFERGGHEGVLDLGTLEKLCVGLLEAEAETRMADRVQAAVRALSSVKADLDVSTVLPHLRPPGEDGPWRMPLVEGHLDLCLVADSVQTIRYLNPVEVVGTGLRLAALRVQARANLYALAPQGRWTVDQRTGVHRSVVHDGHDAARALVAERWFPTEERLFLLMPSRDHLILVPGSAGERVALGCMREARAISMAAAYPLSDQVFVSEGGRLTVFSPRSP